MLTYADVCYEIEGEDAQGAEKWKAALNSDDEDGAPKAAPAGGALDKEALASGYITHVC